MMYSFIQLLFIVSFSSLIYFSFNGVDHCSRGDPKRWRRIVVMISCPKKETDLHSLGVNFGEDDVVMILLSRVHESP